MMDHSHNDLNFMTFVHIFFLIFALNSPLLLKPCLTLFGTLSGTF